MRQNQEYDAHTEDVKMGLFEQCVEVLGEEYLAADLAAEIVGDDAFIADADALKLKKPGGRQSAQNEKQKQAIDKTDLKRCVAQAKRWGGEVFHGWEISFQDDPLENCRENAGAPLAGRTIACARGNFSMIGRALLPSSTSGLVSASAWVALRAIT